MSGFKSFLLRGNLVDTAVAFIMATSFAAVTTAFTNWLVDVLGLQLSNENGITDLWAILVAAVLNFVILAAIVYFLIVMPYAKLKERYFPAPTPGPAPEVVLLTEIRDALAARP
ncbi:MAG: MscL family protein [Nocardioides sp.]